MIPKFVSLGMVVLDELRFPDAPTMYDVAGGSGSFSTLGARIVAGSGGSHEVGCIIMAGDDFPQTIRARFESWSMELQMVQAAGAQSTRGLLTYEDSVFGRKKFEYTTERLQPMPTDLTTSSLLESAAFHILATPQLLQEQVKQLSEQRAKRDIQNDPLVVWEPFPGCCTRDMSEAHLTAAKLVDVFSPNHLECLSLFAHLETYSEDEYSERSALEYCSDIILASGVGREGGGAVVIRAGGDGCLVSSKSIPGRHKWLPPFYSSSSFILDTTGAGNTFMGALTYAMQSGNDVVEASVLASVATSFSLQQIGLPIFTAKDGMEELWNGSGFAGRCEEYKKRQG